MYTIQIVGAGYTGTRIAQFFLEKKQKVFALTRSLEKAQKLKEQGIQPIVADLTQPKTLTGIPAAHFVVLCPAPDAVASGFSPRAQSHNSALDCTVSKSYEAIYLTGIRNYLKAIQKNPKPFLTVYLSSTGIWQDQSGDWFDEQVLPEPQSPKAKILMEAESQILNSGLPAAIFRLSGIYGPDRNRLQAFRDKKWPVSETDRWLNLIHVDDIVASLPLFFKNAKEGEVYLGVDDEPVRVSTLYQWLCDQKGRVSGINFSKLENSKKYKNNKLKSLGISLKYPTFRKFYTELLQSEKVKNV